MTDSYSELVLLRTKELIRELHINQKDKAGAPYMCHLHYVAGSVSHLGPEYEMLGWAHDSIEDHPDKVNFDTFRKLGWPEHMIYALDCITKRKEEKKPYTPYLDRVCLTPHSIEVKLADLDHNRDLSRLRRPTQTDIDRQSKYNDAIVYICTKVGSATKCS